MNTSRLALTLILMLVSLGSFAMSKNEEGLDQIQDDLQLLEIWVEAQQEYRGIPGIVVGLVYDQELVYAKSFGLADVENNTPVSIETPYRIASITKTFTATALVQLRDAGKLRLDDPVKDYLPWFNIQQRFPDEPPITIRQLLTHTSGLPREADFPYWTNHDFPTLDEIKATLASQETVYRPATEIKYSNLGMALAGEVVVAASGMPYAQYIEEHIFEPLGMSESAVHPDKAYQERLVTPYSQRQSDNGRFVEDYVDTEGIAPAANIASTVADLAKYTALQFREYDNSEDAVVKGSSLREMHRVQFLRQHWGSGWGLGWSVWARGGKTINGHGGWVGGNRTQIMFIPEDKVGVIVLTNSDDGEPAFFARYILDHMGPVLVNTFAEPAESIAYDPAWEQYVGRYKEPGPYYTDILIHDGMLVMSTLSFPPENNPDSEVVKLYPEGEHTFRRSGPNGNGELVIFQMDESGKIKQVKTGSNYIYPIDRYPFDH